MTPPWRSLQFRADGTARLSSEYVRFIVARVACTVATYALYLALLRWLRYELAYAISFVFGIAIAYVASARLVFAEPLRLRAALQFPLVYVVQFVATFLLLRLSVEILGIPETWALAIVVVLLLPLTFILSKRIVRGPGPT